MNIVAYILCGLHLVLLLLLVFNRRTKVGLKIAPALVAGAYLVVAGTASHLVAPLIVLEVVACVRFVFHDFLPSAGSSVSRHTERVFSKSLWASLFTWLMACALMAFTFDATMIKATFAAGPLFFFVEYVLRLRRSFATQAFLDRTGKKP